MVSFGLFQVIDSFNHSIHNAECLYLVCSTTLWVGHLSKLVHQEELSDTFGKYGDIVSIDMIHPRGCAFIVMNRRQDAYKAMGGLKNHKLQGRAITISWAAGKGVKSKEWKDYWDIDLGVSYIPWNKLQATTDFEAMEEGGMIDEDAMPGWLKEKIKAANVKKDQVMIPSGGVLFAMADIAAGRGAAVDTTQPPPNGPPQLMQTMVPTPFGMAGVPRMMPPMGMHMPPNMVPGMPLGVPPPIMGMVPGMPPMPLDKSVPPPSGAPPQAGFMGHFPPMPGAMPPHLPPHIPQAPQIPPGGAAGDDHMDIDMDDEPSTSKMQMMNSMGQMFNRPPPQLFPGGQTMPGMPPVPTNMPPIRDNSRERRRDRSDSRERRNSRERDFRAGERGRERDGRMRDRDGRGGAERRNDFNRGSGGAAAMDRDRNSSSRWGGGSGSDRGRSREADMLPHRGDRRNSRDRISRDRGDREKSLSDRLREIAKDPSGGDFGRHEPNEPSQWRDVPTPQGGGGGGNFNPMNFMDQGARGIRPLNMLQMGGGGGGPPIMDGPRGGMAGGSFRGNDYGK